MAISENQLEIWSHQGKTGQFTETYLSHRNNLLDGKSVPYPISDVDVHLQGSYANDTNVWGDSDVDIVLCHTATMFYDSSRMNQVDKNDLENSFSGNAKYRYADFKSDAESYIGRIYNGVVTGKKALIIPGTNTRRSADILVCQAFRRYYSYTGGGYGYHEGVAFFFNGARVDNFPKQHAENCTAKHKATKQNFKPMVRIFKNMRNSMIEKGLLSDGVARSYFIEGMLYNVPDNKFAGSYQDMWVNCFNWIVTADNEQLTTASGLHYLVRDNSAVCWPLADFRTFTAALKEFWQR